VLRGADSARLPVGTPAGSVGRVLETKVAHQAAALPGNLPVLGFLDDSYANALEELLHLHSSHRHIGEEMLGVER
jgi:hypothetical protein